MGFNGTTGDRRQQLLRPSMGEVFDLWLVHYCFSSEAGYTNDDDGALALSLRRIDQVEDAVDVDMAVMASAPGIFGKVSVAARFLTEGSSGYFFNHTIPFPKPFTVPWLAALAHMSFNSSVQVSAEVWFERRRASKVEIAQLMVTAGAVART